jgi:hypothetical protein
VVTQGRAGADQAGEAASFAGLDQHHQYQYSTGGKPCEIDQHEENLEHCSFTSFVAGQREFRPAIIRGGMGKSIPIMRKNGFAQENFKVVK